jgi:hypothetical protein
LWLVPFLPALSRVLAFGVIYFFEMTFVAAFPGSFDLWSCTFAAPNSAEIKLQFPRIGNFFQEE